VPSEFELTDEPLPDGHLVAVRGEIDLFTAPELKQLLSEIVGAGTTRLVIDLSQTTFLDSTALGVLIGTVKRLGEEDGRMVLVSSDAAIAKTFQITGLDRIFEIHPTRDEAISALSGATEPASQ